VRDGGVPGCANRNEVVERDSERVRRDVERLVRERQCGAPQCSILERRRE
jgi:hypothetical protein